MGKVLARFAQDQSGATAIEYGLIASFIGIVIITAAGLLGAKLADVYVFLTGQMKSS